MSTSSAATRPDTIAAQPYTVLINVTNVQKTPSSYTVGVKPYVDLGLTAGQHRTLTDAKARNKLKAAASFEGFLLLAGLMVGLVGASFSMSSADYPAIAGWIVGGALIACAGLAMNRHVRAGKTRIDTLVAELTAAGVLIPAPLYGAKLKDLKRIQSQLTKLHKRGITGEDIHFRAAAEMVVTQDRHRPTLKHAAIADSNGTDPATRKIRKLVKEQRRAWKADVADAEIAIIALDDLVAPALKTPAKV